MRRVVVSGMGIVSSIGNNTQEVLASLREARPGVSFSEKYKELGFRCQVHAGPSPDPAEELDRRTTRFMGKGAQWNYIAMRQAIQDAGLEDDEVSNVRTGIIMGSGGPSTRAIVDAADVTAPRAPAVSAVRGAEASASTNSATLANAVQDQGRELYDLLCLRDVEPLHRQRLRADPDGQAGHGVRRRRRRTRLDAVESF